MPHVNNGKELALHYQFRQNMQTDLLGSHSLYGSAQLGRHREDPARARGLRVSRAARSRGAAVRDQPGRRRHPRRRRLRDVVRAPHRRHRRGGPLRRADVVSGWHSYQSEGKTSASS